MIAAAHTRTKQLVALSAARQLAEVVKMPDTEQGRDLMLKVLDRFADSTEKNGQQLNGALADIKGAVDVLQERVSALTSQVADQAKAIRESADAEVQERKLQEETKREGRSQAAKIILAMITLLTTFAGGMVVNCQGRSSGQVIEAPAAKVEQPPEVAP